MDRRRLLLVIAFVGSVLVFGFLLYFFLFRSLFTDDGVQPNVNVNGGGTLPGIINGNISVLQNINGTVSLPSFPGGTIDLTTPTEVARGGLTIVEDYDVNARNLVSGPGGTILYDPDQARFLRFDGDELVRYSEQQFFNVEEVAWSNQQEKAVLEFPDGSNILYNFRNGSQVTLPQELTDFSFDTTGDAIVAKWLGSNRDENWLMVGNGEGENFRLVEPLGDRQHNVQVDVSPDNQVVALYRRAEGANTLVVRPIGTDGQKFKEFSVDGLNFESQWSGLNNTLLYSVANPSQDYAPTLYLTSGTNNNLGASRISLNVNTWAHKCTFSRDGNSVYCAEPIDLPRGAGLYPDVAVGSPEAFFRIDLLSGQKIPLALPVGNQISYSAESVYLSPDESRLFFTDEVTGNLHSIRLR